jgi:hypothetical protein
MINATITTYSGDKKVIPFQNREAVQLFIKELPKRLSKNTSVFFSATSSQSQEQLEGKNKNGIRFNLCCRLLSL